MTKFQSDTANFIHYVLEQFPDMDNADGEILAGCLTSLTQGNDLTPKQVKACKWWNAWLKARKQSCLASIVGFSLTIRDMPTAVHDELVEARRRLRRGEDMTPRQASFWGHHVVKQWDANSRCGLTDWSRRRPSFR